ncbi:MAG: reverse transcriptase domain-containing protein [Pseudomonadota bacterium]
MESKIDALIEDLETKKIITKISSPWNFPIVVVPKKNGDIRMCIDYRKLNAITERPVYYIPDSKQLFDNIDGSKYFSSLDLSMGYHQIEMNQNDVEKTAFTTRTGQYAFQRMPFGLCGAPQSFQRVMASILRDQNWKHCVIYLDDILVHGKTLKEHNERLRSVLRCLSNAGVKLSPNKCSFMKTETVYLGHVIDKKGLRTDPAKIEKILNWPEPKSTKELHTFISLCGYYRKFIDEFALIVRPLEILLRDSKGKVFTWTTFHSGVMTKLKKRLSEAPILMFPRRNGKFILDTDASHEAVGAVLSQIQDGEEKVIAYASHALSKHEIQYCVTRKELLAVYKYVKHFNHYLMGQKFLIRTDHRALTWMLNWKRPNTSQYCSWIAELELYDFDIEHRKGEQHLNADAMSRYPFGSCQQCELKHTNPRENTNVKKLKETCCRITENDRCKDAVEFFINVMKQDTQIMRVQQDSVPRNKESLVLWKHRRSLRLIDDSTLGIQIPNGTLLVIPKTQNRHKLINKIHSQFGHLGISGTRTIIKDYYYWPTMDLDITMLVNECCLCQRYKHNTGRRRNLTKGNLRGNYPFQKVAMDIAGPMRSTRRGNRYILGMIDHFSKYPVLIPIKSTDSGTIIEAIFTKWISVFGIPDSLHSDRGANLNSEKMREFCDGLGIKKTATTPYYPQGDGIIERLFRTVKPLIGIVAEERRMDWDEAISYVEMGLRNKRNASGFSPNMILFGQNVRAWDTGTLQTTKQHCNSLSGYMSKLINKISDIHNRVNAKVVVERENTRQTGYNTGDLVWARKIGSKSGNVLFDGPYRIIKVIGKNAFRLQDESGKVIDRNIIYLKTHHARKEINNGKVPSASLTSIKSFTTDANSRMLTSPSVDREEAEETENQIPRDSDATEDRGGKRYPTRVRTLPARYGYS